MNIDIIAGHELSPELEQQWRAVQARNTELASPYFCPEFTQAVAATRADVFVAVLRDRQAIIGFFPFQRSRRGVGRPVGGPINDCQGVIIEREVEWPVEQLMRACGLDIWDFDHLLATQGPFAPYHQGHSESPIMDLSAGFEDYAHARRQAGSKQIQKVGTLSRKLEREVGELRAEIECTDDAAFDRLLNWKSAQYRESGLVDVTAQDWIRATLNRIRATRSSSFAGLLSVLWAGPNMIAAHMGMRSESVWHYWFPAYDAAYARYSPGLILLLEMARRAEDVGPRIIDLGKGEALYKERLANGAVPLAEGSVQLASLNRRLRQFGNSAEAWIRHSPIAPLLRAPGRMIKTAARRAGYR